MYPQCMEKLLYLRPRLAIHVLVTANTTEEELSSIELLAKADVQCHLGVINMKSCFVHQSLNMLSPLSIAKHRIDPN